jgi:methylthioribose-1-phosphate isomerase
MKIFEPIKYERDSLTILNQLLLPSIIEYETYSDYIDVIDAIDAMKIRGTTLVGIAAAYGLLISLNNKTFINKAEFITYYKNIRDLFLKTRKTIRSLSYIFEYFDSIVNNETLSIEDIIESLENNAIMFENREKLYSEKISEQAVNKVFNKKNSYKFITIGNYGCLSTGGVGNVTGIFKSLFNKGIELEVFINETRPHFQGSRLTAWELKNNNIPYKIITSSETAKLMNDITIDAILIGAEHVAKNGDVISKIGSLSLSIIAKYFNIPVIVVSSTTMINTLLKKGSDLIIESCKTNEILSFNGVKTAPLGSKILNYSFDNIPNNLIHLIITEDGILEPLNLK